MFYLHVKGTIATDRSVSGGFSFTFQTHNDKLLLIDPAHGHKA